MASNAVLDLIINLAGNASEKVAGIADQIGGLGPIAAGAGLAIGGALLAGLGKSVDLASEASEGVNQLQAQLGLTADEANALGDVAVDVFGNNWGDSLTDVHAAIGDVRQQMKDLTDDELQGVTEGALAIRDVFGVEVSETANAANTLMRDFGLTGKEATDFIAKGFQSGLNNSGDFLDSIGEYAPQFAENKATAAEFFSTLETGSQGGVLGTDKVADLFKEMRLRITDDSALTRDALEQLGIPADDFFKGMRDGSMTGMEAFQLIQDGLARTTDPVKQQAAGVALLGTQWEDMGASAVLGIDTTARSMEEISGATDSLNAKYNSLGSVFGGAWRMIQTEVLLPIGESLLNLANSAMPTISAAISGMGSAIEFVKNNAETMGPILASVGVVIGGLLVAAFYAWAASAWAAAAGTIAAMTPILPIILGVAAVVAVLGVAWNQNWGGIQEKTAAVWGFLSGTVWPWLQAAFDQITAVLLPALSSAWGVVWPAIQSATATVYAFLKDTVWAWLSGTAWPWLKDYALPALSAAFSASWSAISTAISTVYTWWKGTFSPWLSETFTTYKAWMEDLLFKWNFALAVLSGYLVAWGAVVGKVRDTVSGYITDIKGYFSAGWDAVQTAVSTAWNAIGNAISGPIEAARGMVSRAIDLIKGYIQSAIDGINRMIDAINSIPGIPNLPEVPGGSSTQSSGGGSRSFSSAGAGGDFSSTAIFEANAITVIVPPGTPTTYRKQAEDGSYRGTQKALAEAGFRADIRKRTP